MTTSSMCSGSQQGLYSCLQHLYCTQVHTNLPSASTFSQHQNFSLFALCSLPFLFSASFSRVEIGLLISIVILLSHLHGIHSGSSLKWYNATITMKIGILMYAARKSGEEKGLRSERHPLKITKRMQPTRAYAARSHCRCDL